jgi:spermidine synthase
LKTVVLISCVKKKVPYRAEAKDLYASPFFKLNLRYARSLNPDGIFVLSAQHYLVGLEEELEPYERTLNRMPSKRVKQ